MPLNLSVQLPRFCGETRRLNCPVKSALPLTIAYIAQQHKGPVLLVVPSSRDAVQIQDELPHYTTIPINYFPEWGTLPYDNFSPDPHIISARLTILYQLPFINQGVVILPISTLMQKLCPKSFLTKHVLLLKTAQIISRKNFCIQLVQAGYCQAEQIHTHGEFAVRGSVLDIYPMGSKLPYRIDFFGDTIETINTFNVDTQRSHPKKIEQINLLPAHEFATNKIDMKVFCERWQARFNIKQESKNIYQQLITGQKLPPGIEYWQPLFFDEPLATFFNYIPRNTLIISVDDELEQVGKQFQIEIKQRFDSLNCDPLRPLIFPNELWLDAENIFAQFKNYRHIHCQQSIANFTPNDTILPVSSLPNLKLQLQQNIPLVALQQFLENFNGIVIFSVETIGRRELLCELLKSIQVIPTYISDLQSVTKPGIYITITLHQEGFILGQHWALICETDLLGQKVIHHPPKRQNAKKAIQLDMAVQHLTELHLGQPVVHLQHGVGRYRGLTKIENRGVSAEYFVIEYAEQAKLYVPVSSLYLISRYSSCSQTEAPLHKLGSDTWVRARQKALEKIRDIAAELLDIYAQRAANHGFAHKLNQEQYHLFCQAFPFDETPDQALAIQAVLQDMCQPISMDRLICGDVGFGKTEVALRASFLAITNKKQVLVLVPTTLLAQQHADNFRNRFANWNVRIDVLSRFRSLQSQQNILKQLADGQIDILIGTHKILQKKLVTKDLGLLIIDEEHRFGVQQKEKIKKLRAHVDILTLTATPIPRTLNMAMHGIRDLCIIATPPVRRLAVKTFIRESDSKLIREALLRETLRGGQVYYVYNQVNSIEFKAEKLRELVPEVRIAVAHGQMPERKLEQIMSDFYHQRFNVLVCSTIIETGIDIPTANTIIIERADHFGLAQLHQLRGRVGRSYHQAYAYLLTPNNKLLTTDARKRLEAINALDELGVGFALASHDLDIRGAGELLGAEQSGQMNAIGFTLYHELLEKAVFALKNGQEPSLSQLSEQQIDIDLCIPALLPDEYISNINTRLYWYKRLASVTHIDQLQKIEHELIDRFGTLPTAAHNLFQLTQIRLLAQQLLIKRIDANKQGGFIDFYENTPIHPSNLINLLQHQPSVFRLKNSTRLQFSKALDQTEQRIQFIYELMHVLKQGITLTLSHLKGYEQKKYSMHND